MGWGCRQLKLFEYTTNRMKVLVLGHGWRAWKERERARCAPMEVSEWNMLVQDADKETLTFLDCQEEEEPDIVECAGNDWTKNITEPHSYDYVIDSITHLRISERSMKQYWDSIKYSLKSEGVYIGWNDAIRPYAYLRITAENIDKHYTDIYPLKDKSLNNGIYHDFGKY